MNFSGALFQKYRFSTPFCWHETNILVFFIVCWILKLQFWNKRFLWWNAQMLQNSLMEFKIEEQRCCFWLFKWFLNRFTRFNKLKSTYQSLFYHVLYWYSFNVCILLENFTWWNILIVKMKANADSCTVSHDISLFVRQWHFGWAKRDILFEPHLRAAIAR